MRVGHDAVMELHLTCRAEVQHPVDAEVRVVLEQRRHGDSLECRAWLHVLRDSEIIRLFVFLLFLIVFQRCHHLDESRLHIHHNDAALLCLVLGETFTQRLFRHVLNLCVDGGVYVFAVAWRHVDGCRHVDESTSIDTATHLQTVFATQAGVVSAFQSNLHRI